MAIALRIPQGRAGHASYGLVSSTLDANNVAGSLLQNTGAARKTAIVTSRLKAIQNPTSYLEERTAALQRAADKIAADAADLVARLKDTGLSTEEINARVLAASQAAMNAQEALIDLQYPLDGLAGGIQRASDIESLNAKASLGAFGGSSGRRRYRRKAKK